MNLNIYGQNSPTTIQDLEASLKSQYDRLNQLKLMSNNIQNNQTNLQPQQDIQTNNIQSQRYYLDCGNKEDWDEFLKLNYGITEKNIFDDYKLFLQAKQEIIDEQGRSKLESMKERIKNNGNNYKKSTVGTPVNVNPNVSPDMIKELANAQQSVLPKSVQSAIQPMETTIKQSIPTGVDNIANNTINGGIVQPINPVLPEGNKVVTTKGRSKKA